MTKSLVTLRVNGETHSVAAEPHHSLLEVLREELGLTGTKHGCELGECGACTVLVDGRPVLSCLTLPQQIGAAEVTTVEGLARGPELHPLQVAFAEEGAAQCGYCTPGMLLSAKALLDAHPRPTREQMAEAISGNLCRCTGYTSIYEAIESATLKMSSSRVAGAEPVVPGVAGPEPVVPGVAGPEPVVPGVAGAEPLREAGPVRIGAKRR